MESYKAETMKPLKANFDAVTKGQLENFFIDIKNVCAYWVWNKTRQQSILDCSVDF